MTAVFWFPSLDLTHRTTHHARAHPASDGGARASLTMGQASSVLALSPRRQREQRQNGGNEAVQCALSSRSSSRSSSPGGYARGAGCEPEHGGTADAVVVSRLTASPIYERARDLPPLSRALRERCQYAYKQLCRRRHRDDGEARTRAAAGAALAVLPSAMHDARPTRRLLRALSHDELLALFLHGLLKKLVRALIDASRASVGALAALADLARLFFRSRRYEHGVGARHYCDVHHYARVLMLTQVRVMVVPRLFALALANGDEDDEACASAEQSDDARLTLRAGALEALFAFTECVGGEGATDATHDVLVALVSFLRDKQDESFASLLHALAAAPPSRPASYTAHGNVPTSASKALSGLRSCLEAQPDVHGASVVAVYAGLLRSDEVHDARRRRVLEHMARHPVVPDSALVCALAQCVADAPRSAGCGGDRNLDKLAGVARAPPPPSPRSQRDDSHAPLYACLSTLLRAHPGAVAAHAPPLIDALIERAYLAEPPASAPAPGIRAEPMALLTQMVECEAVASTLSARHHDACLLLCARTLFAPRDADANTDECVLSRSVIAGRAALSLASPRGEEAAARSERSACAMEYARRTLAALIPQLRIADGASADALRQSEQYVVAVVLAASDQCTMAARALLARFSNTAADDLACLGRLRCAGAEHHDGDEDGCEKGATRTLSSMCFTGTLVSSPCARDAFSELSAAAQCLYRRACRTHDVADDDDADDDASVQPFAWALTVAVTADTATQIVGPAQAYRVALVDAHAVMRERVRDAARERAREREACQRAMDKLRAEAEELRARVHALQMEKRNLQSAATCVVCLEALAAPVAVSCGHVFCGTCYDALVHRHDVRACPTCRHVFDGRAALPLHLF